MRSLERAMVLVFTVIITLVSYVLVYGVPFLGVFLLVESVIAFHEYWYLWGAIGALLVLWLALRRPARLKLYFDRRTRLFFLLHDMILGTASLIVVYLMAALVFYLAGQYPDPLTTRLARLLGVLGSQVLGLAGLAIVASALAYNIAYNGVSEAKRRVAKEASPQQDVIK
ncbi:MAG: hypothetical protein JSV52_12060 [Candidatus Zixiibacteriota bacterium]|nr:MAG: hypothetical protein JSV52_12060 [candidate division Zixibacteria bacterium]